MKKKRRHVAAAVGLLALVSIWEACVRILCIPLYVLPAPSNVVLALWTQGPALLEHAAVTLAEASLGMAIALALALALGMLMDACPAVKASVYPVLVVTQTVPMIVLAPILIIYLGFGMLPKILTVVLMCFFPIVVSFTDGMAQVEPGYIHLLQTYGARPWQVYAQVKAPAALPSLFSGLRVAATYSVSGAIVGEWIGSQAGLGYYLLRVKNGYMLDRAFACVVVIVLLSLFMNGAVQICQRVCLPYLKKQEK